MTRYELKQLADYVQDLEEGLVEYDYDVIAMQTELPEVHKFIERLMEANKHEPKSYERTLLASVELKARQCRDCMLERLAVRN